MPARQVRSDSDRTILTTEASLAGSRPDRNLIRQGSDPGCSLRMAFVIAAVAAAGLVDLALTLHFMTTTGMFELNPLARAVAAGGPAAVLVFKLAMIAANGVPLWLLRARRSARIGALCSLTIMLALSVHWVRFVEGMRSEGIAAHLADAARIDDPFWVRFQTR